MPEHFEETRVRAQLARLLDRLPDLDVAAYEGAEPGIGEELAKSRWGLAFRNRAGSEPKSARKPLKKEAPDEVDLRGALRGGKI